MPKKKTPELDPKEQFKRFQEAAREHGVDEQDARDKFKGLSRPDSRRDSPTRKSGDVGSRRRT